MSPNEDDTRRMLFQAVQDLAKQLGMISETVKEDVAQLLRSYREDNHRAIMGIHIRIVSLEDTIETDRAARIARQQTLDGELRGIRANQRFWIRLAILTGLIAIGIVLGIWLF